MSATKTNVHHAPILCRPAASFFLLLAAAFALLGIVGRAHGQQVMLDIVPNPAPASSSVTVTIGARIGGSDMAASALSGSTLLTLDSTATPRMAQLSDLVIELDDAVDFSLLGLAASVDASAARVRMVTPGLAGEVSDDGTFNQLDSVFQFEGQLDLSIQEEPFDLSDIDPASADLIGIQLSDLQSGVQAELQFDLDFVVEVNSFLGPIPLTINVAGGVLAVEETLGGSIGDFDQNGLLDETDIALIQSAIRNGNATYDLNDDGFTDSADLEVWVREVKQTWFGDGNLDGQFNSTDLVGAFQEGQYEDTLEANSRWATGDWDSDAEFTSSDLVVAFQDGGYEQGPRVAAVGVPEPVAMALVIECVVLLTLVLRPTQRADCGRCLNG